MHNRPGKKHTVSHALALEYKPLQWHCYPLILITIYRYHQKQLAHIPTPAFLSPLLVPTCLERHDSSCSFATNLRPRVDESTESTALRGNAAHLTHPTKSEALHAHNSVSSVFQPTISSGLKKNAISTAAVSAASEPCTAFASIESANSARNVPGFAS